MAQAWLKHGSSMAQAWLVKHGSSMAQAWLKHGSSMAQAWLKHGSKLSGKFKTQLQVIEMPQTYLGRTAARTHVPWSSIVWSPKTTETRYGQI